MNINTLIAIIKRKVEDGIVVENIKIEDKSFLHKNHSGNQKDKYHLKVFIESKQLSKMTKLESNKKIYKLLGDEIKTYIHSIQILLS